MEKILIPKTFDLDASIEFANQLYKLPNSEHYIFDFSQMGRIEPFAMLFVSSNIKNFRQSKPSSKFTAENYQSHKYPAHMGFFQAFGLRFGKEPGEAQGSSTYLPLSTLAVNDIIKKAEENYEPVGETIERIAEKLAKILSQEKNYDVEDTLTYSFREIIRNVVEHSEAAQFSYCAQYWQTYNKVEIAILDEGVGLKKSLSSNPFLSINNNREAINFALLPGISSKTYDGIKRKKEDVWQNSGFGLFMTQCLCRKGGSFFLCSGDTGLLLKDSQKRYLSVGFEGTALRLVLDTDSIISCSKALRAFKEEGYRIARELRKDSEVYASMASMMLSKDFK